MSSGRVVISSVTGKPIPWGERAAAEPAASGARPSRDASGIPGPPVIPDRADEDAPEAGERSAHEADLLRDVPPHWGTGS